MRLSKQFILRLFWFYLGLAVLSVGYVLVIKPGFGASAWDILHLGISTRLAFPLSGVILGTGAAIVLLNWTLGIPPTLGMVLNVASIGPMMQVLLERIAVPATTPGRWAMLATGILLVGLGTALYVSAGIGAGPRDGMMIGLTRRLNLPVGIVKNGIDVTVALAGWWLGGPLGFGSVLVALGLGPSMQMGMALVSRLSTIAPLTGFVQPVSLKRS